MGESVTEGTILEWHVAEGQEVAEGDTVVEVSTDKIDAEVPAPASGVVTKILAQPDDTVEVGQALAQIDPNGARSDNGASADPSPLKESEGLVMGGGEGDEDLGDDTAGADSPQPGVTETPTPEDEVPAGDAPAEKAGGTLVISMPEMGESVTEGTVLEWHVGEGDSVSEGDTVVEVSTDKIDAEVPAPASGTVTKLLVEPDATVQVGQALAEMTSGAAPTAAGAAEPSADPAAPGRIPAEPGSPVADAPSEEAGGTSVFKARVRLDTPNEVRYFQNGGILHRVLRDLRSA
jgi:2-oxoglutarate dehydrogenase E2 component (dihydrolipoamide succinyltransferase)